MVRVCVNCGKKENVKQLSQQLLLRVPTNTLARLRKSNNLPGVCGGCKFKLYAAPAFRSRIAIPPRSSIEKDEEIRTVNRFFTRSTSTVSDTPASTPPTPETPSFPLVRPSESVNQTSVISDAFDPDDCFGIDDFVASDAPATLEATFKRPNSMKRLSDLTTLKYQKKRATEEARELQLYLQSRTGDSLSDLMGILGRCNSEFSREIFTSMYNAKKQFDRDFLSSIGIHESAMHNVLIALYIKDELKLSDLRYHALRVRGGNMDWSAITPIKQLRAKLNEEVKQRFQLHDVARGKAIKLEPLMLALFEECQVFRSYPANHRFIFKLALDGRNLGNGQVGVGLVPLNLSHYATQAVESVKYLLIYSGKETKQHLRDATVDLIQQLKKLRDEGLEMGGEKWDFDFVYVSDHKISSKVFKINHPKGCFCIFCLIKTTDKVLGACFTLRTSIDNSWGRCAYLG